MSDVLGSPRCDHENGWWPCGGDPDRCTQPADFEPPDHVPGLCTGSDCPDPWHAGETGHKVWDLQSVAFTFNRTMRWVLLAFCVVLWGEFAWLLARTGDWTVLLGPVLTSVFTALYWLGCSLECRVNTPRSRS